MGMKSADETKALVLKAFDTLFNKRDYAKAAEFWSENYIQHSAHIEPGRDGLFNLVKAAPDSLRYEKLSPIPRFCPRRSGGPAQAAP